MHVSTVGMLIFGEFNFSIQEFQFFGAPKFLDEIYEAPPISHYLAKFHSDRHSRLEDFAPKPIAPKIVLGEGPNFWDLYCLTAHTSNHV